jgi:radical SAM superfamily enzyme YgiQ (UPF0313 family)
MKILLIASNFTKLSGFMPSLGLAYLKSYMCEHTCHEIEVLDEIKINRIEIKNKISAFKPDIIGITCLTIYRYDAIKAAELAKKYAPDCKIVLGGPHPSFMYEQILNQYSFIDIVYCFRLSFPVFKRPECGSFRPAAFAILADISSAFGKSFYTPT